MYRTVLAVILLAPLLSGCIYSREIAHLRRDVERATGADLDREFVLVLGPGTFRTVGWLARNTPEDHARFASDYVTDIQQVKVGVYRVDESPDRQALALGSIPRIQRSGWEVAVRVEEADEAVWVLYRERYGGIRDVLVLALDEEHLAIVRVRGHLDRMVARAVVDREFIRQMADW